MKSEFKIAKSDIGHIKLSDETIIYFRVVVINVREGIQRPTGPDFSIKHTVLFSTSSPPSIKEMVKEKTPPPLDGAYMENLEIWENQKIVEAKSAYEECEYVASDGHTYKVTAEMAPTIVARTLEYKDDDGNPIYHVRWGTKISTEIEK